MIPKRLIAACLGVPLVFASIAGAYVVGRGSAPAPQSVAAPRLVSDEQRVRMDGGLYSLLRTKDPAALSDFPSPLFCYHRAKYPTGTACVYGVTYSNESTRRYTIVIAKNNSQMSWMRTAVREAKTPAA